MKHPVLESYKNSIMGTTTPNSVQGMDQITIPNSMIPTDLKMNVAKSFKSAISRCNLAITAMVI